MKLKKFYILFLLFFIVLIPSVSKATDLDLYSEAAIIIENKTGKVLYEKNSEEKLFPASTTKIMSAILAIEKSNLSDEITVTKSGIANIPSGYSLAYLSEGEVISVENLLKVLLIHSANEASNILAEHICGSVPEFVNLMNEKAKELGCTNTHFVTTNGIHDDNHYTTAKDLVTIARYCMQNETFRNIVSMSSCTIPATNKSAERKYKNTNEMVIPTSSYYYPGCIGIKTGFTSQAQNCLVSATNKDGLQLIAVVLKANVTENNRSARNVDTKNLFDYVYDNFSFKKIAKKSDVIKNIEVKNATDETKSLDLLIEDDISVLINKNDKIDVNPEVTLNEDISAPISENTVLGTVRYKIGDETFTKNLIASHSVEKIDYSFVYLFCGLIIACIFLIFVSVLFFKKKKKGKHSWKM